MTLVLHVMSQAFLDSLHKLCMASKEACDFETNQKSIVRMNIHKADISHSLATWQGITHRAPVWSLWYFDFRLEEGRM